jgi:hypothetical protein
MEILQAQAGLSRLTIFYCILLTLRESIVRECGFENELPAHLAASFTVGRPPRPR